MKSESPRLGGTTCSLHIVCKYSATVLIYVLCVHMMGYIIYNDISVKIDIALA